MDGQYYENSGFGARGDNDGVHEKNSYKEGNLRVKKEKCYLPSK